MNNDAEILILVHEYFGATRFEAIKRVFSNSDERSVDFLVLLILFFSLFSILCFIFNSVFFLWCGILSALIGFYVYLNGMSGVDPAYKKTRAGMVKKNLSYKKIKLTRVDRFKIENLVMHELDKRSYDANRVKMIFNFVFALALALAFLNSKMIFVFSYMCLLLGALLIEHHYYCMKNGGKVNLIVNEIMDIVEDYAGHNVERSYPKRAVF